MLQQPGSADPAQSAAGRARPEDWLWPPEGAASVAAGSAFHPAAVGQDSGWLASEILDKLAVAAGHAQGSQEKLPWWKVGKEQMDPCGQGSPALR